MDREFRADSKTELVEMLSGELRRIKERLTEMKVQVDQTAMVVEREQTRNSDIAAELRTLQDNLETVPRQDIKSKYDEALDARFRLTTMRGQLEKFQAIRESLDDQAKTLQNVLNKLEGVSSLGSGEEHREPVKVVANVVRIIQAQEGERQRLARQMHDGPAQSLTNFILQAEICQRLFDRNPQKAGEELVNLKNAANVTFQKVREFIFDLRPMMLDDLGIVPTVRRYVDSFREKNDLEIKLDITGEERRMENHREVMIFRALQELLGHARDYANANHITVRLDISNNRVKASVEDDGRDFDPQQVYNPEETIQDARIQGLVNLRERFELVRGTASIFSSEGEGTIVRIELPVTDEA